MTRLVLAALVAAAPLPCLAAEVRAVALVVTDAQGAFVGDVRAEEVRVLENGEPREVVSWAVDDRPLAAALVLDTSTGAAAVFRGQAFGAVSAFVARLPPGTRCTLWAAGDHPRKVGDLQGDSKAVEKRVAQAFSSGGTNTLLETLVDAASGLGREPGRRRALVAVSGAGAGHTNLSPGDVTAGARKAAARVLGVMYREGVSGSPGSLTGLDTMRDSANLSAVGASDHERILSSLAQATGGRFESVPTATGVDRILESYAAELGGQYRIRYAAAEGKGPRRIEVRLARPGVRWRVVVDTP
jgi:VWFA-related protein